MQKLTNTVRLITVLAANLSFSTLTSSEPGFECEVKNWLGEHTISDVCIQKLFFEGLITTDDLRSKNFSWAGSEGAGAEGITDWKYVGPIGRHHVLYIQAGGSSWRTHGLYVIEILKDRMIVTSTINGPKNCEVLDCSKIKDQRISYSKVATGESFFNSLTEANPELKALFPKICGELHHLRGQSLGFFEHESQINDSGIIQSDTIIAFIPCEGWPPYSGKRYQGKRLKELFLKLCKQSG